ncbi:hypothetical protein FJTKL_14193 [Diaporthe vaccinii]|uniref:Uncharacterized protein n=1 Tax=Diaporthe vaccinii TaxID=105482 RepID=A0ABR4E8H3_9PEZI
MSAPSVRSSEPLWHLVQYYMIRDFNTANENKDVNLKYWPIFQVADGDDQCPCWMVLVVTDAHIKFPDADDDCRIRIDEAWLEARRVENPVASIRVENIEHRVFATYRVKIPQSLNNGKQLHWTPLEMTRDPKDGSLAPVFSHHKMLRANLRLTAMSTPELLDQIRYKWVPEATRSFQDPKHYHDIYRWGAEKEFEFETAAVRNFNRTSVFPCWLILCHPREDELYQADPDDMLLQECLVVMQTPGLEEAFPKIGDLCDVAIGAEMPALDKDAKDTKDNLRLKPRSLKYFRATRLENSEWLSLDKKSVKGSSWKRYSTFKVLLPRKPVDDPSDYTPFQDFECKLDRSNIARQDGGSRPRIILDKQSSFKAYVWVDISTTTLSVELNALKTAISKPSKSHVANIAANRVMQQFKSLGRNDLCIVRAYNFNYKGKWGTRRYLKTEQNDETPAGFDFDECFPAHHANHIPQIRKGLRTNCLALTLREKVQTA